MLWLRYRDGPDDELSLESSGVITQEKLGHLNFSDYSVSSKEKSSGNILNSVWYQTEGAFPVNGVPETRQHAFWVSVHKHYYQLSKKLEGMKLPQCALTLQVVKRVEKGAAAPLVCLQQQVPFVAFRALSDLAGGGSSPSNEASIFGSLAAENAVLVAIKFISSLA
ncbi:hypothetical protein OPV22_004301 [Ensete ventricosum]|uniref:Nucleoside phosphorylase domain-containing protein n=1 Tax=Ensete ventricosum TaxID=4639 RepID=A0AAV8S327_ENSVE|nr:hypothetical protein OPV22_004301 [Ensete ventricosum]